MFQCQMLTNFFLPDNRSWAGGNRTPNCGCRAEIDGQIREAQ